MNDKKVLIGTQCEDQYHYLCVYDVFAGCLLALRVLEVQPVFGGGFENILTT